MKGVQNVFGIKPNEVRENGLASISCYRFIHKENPLYNIRVTMKGNDIFRMADGEYVKLIVNNQLVMSDTRMEKITNTEFVQKANGRVLIAGLGIGLIINNIREKVASGEVSEIVVIEKYKDVIDLISPYYADLPITYVLADILEYKPTKSDVYDTIYFDIWAEINTEMLTEIKMLHNRWKGHKNKNNPNAFMNSWMKEYLQRKKKQEKRYAW